MKVSHHDGYEFWIYYENTARVYEVFLDPEGESYIGCFDTVEEAKRWVVEDWIPEQEGN